MKKDGKKKSSTGPGALIFVAIVLLSAISNISETAETIVGIIIFAVVIIGAIVLASKAKKKTGKAAKASSFASSVIRTSVAKEHPVYNQPVHSHDQLNQTKVVRCTDGYEHWVNQLNGFLAAGIIDRAEYRVLLQKHPRESFEEYI